MRIARPILLVSTPIGVVFGLREAWRLAGPAMAVLMAAMITVVGGFVWMTVRTIRRESREENVTPQKQEPRRSGVP
jgi:ABC-type nickel/cobalt efflux system permease component RcnA